MKKHKITLHLESADCKYLDIRARKNVSRNIIIIRLSRLGRAQEKISVTMGLIQNRVSKIIGNAIFCNIDNFLSSKLRKLISRLKLQFTPPLCSLETLRMLSWGQNGVFKRMAQDPGSLVP